MSRPTPLAFWLAFWKFTLSVDIIQWFSGKYIWRCWVKACCLDILTCDSICSSLQPELSLSLSSAWNRTNFLLSFCVTSTQVSLAQQQRDRGRDRKRVGLNLDPLPADSLLDRWWKWKFIRLPAMTPRFFWQTAEFITFCGIMIFSLELPPIPGVVVWKLFTCVCVCVIF